MYRACVAAGSVAPGRFDADPDPDPTFQVDMDPDPNFLAREREKKCLSNLHFFLLNNLTQLFMINFLTNKEGEGARGEG